MVKVKLFQPGKSKRRKGKFSGRVGNRRAAYFFLLPSMIILSLFVFIPLIAVVAISFFNITLFMNDISFAGFDNFIQLFRDDRIGNATLNTLYFALLEVTLQAGLALVLSSFVSRNTRFCRAMRTIYYIPFICSMTAIGIVWSMLLDPTMGLVSYSLRKIGIETVGFLKDIHLAMPTIIAVTVWKGFGYTLTLLTAAILAMPQSLYEAADIDGAGCWQKFIRITVPGIWPTISFCIVTNMIGSLQVFDQAYVMTQGGPSYRTETLVQYIYDRGFQTSPYSLGYASAISVYLLVIVAAITFALRRYVLKREED